MHARYVAGLTIRPLVGRELAPAAPLFQRLAGSAKLDPDTHVLVVDSDNSTRPVAVGQLTRGCDGGAIRVAVADGHRGRGLGALLARELAADARAAGITRLRVTVCDEDRQAVSRLARIVRRLLTPRAATAPSS